jgi:hypothetical protein
MLAVPRAGDRFDRLTFLHLAPSDDHGNKRADVCCDCGAVKTVYLRSILVGKTKSCGCLNLERVRDMGHANRSHGKSRSPEWISWRGMRQRCLDPNSIDYANYGGRGITICDQWLGSFQNFLDDMGPRPALEYTLERVDNEGPYEPGNCVWATRQEQSLNRRLTSAVVAARDKALRIAQIKASFLERDSKGRFTAAVRGAA